ncbi:extracellular solute-binding protein [Mesorhizobium sp. B3-1-3]|uniref:extracellular solute-binding protein n=1 Tax=unclassified Mesorhizobium TaxID=325217 RepID=UPI00112A4D0C|nr:MULTISPECIES: extracellular solute-binding protein [unclassified Mesorhizobium]TPI57347.1 extracellular solute-binding protein [Mesorhizobium sp. B3-1-8]TPI63500.1 extracellular solute-binding protein [Mesorhizobium sp. B3-1-3]
MNKPTRRTILKGAGTLAVATLASPALVKNAFSSSGSLNYMAWAGYDYKPHVEAFKKATGITLNIVSQQPDADTMLAQCKLAANGGGIDIVEPAMMGTPAWIDAGIVQPYDLTKIKMSNFIDGAPGTKPGDQGEVNGKRYYLPSSWGTEALVYSKADAPLAYGTASLADLFDTKYAGKVVLRPSSGLPAMGRLMEAQGKLPKPFADSYKDEATMREIWDIVLAEAVKHKSSVGQFWTSEADAEGAFRTNGCVLGLCWDSTGAHLGPDGFGYMAPKEGAFAWSQGFMLLKNAANVEQAHEFVNWLSSPEGSAAWATMYTCNPIGKGAIDIMPKATLDFYKTAFPEDAIKKTWWWPARQGWAVKLINEYGDKWRAA